MSEIETLPTEHQVGQDERSHFTDVSLVPTEGEKVALPRRPGESRFAPQQYYYAASKTGAVPSWAVPPT